MKKPSLAQLAGLLLAILTSFQTAKADNILISRGSTWKYNNSNLDLGTAWRNLDYDESGWGGPSPGSLGDNIEGGFQMVQSVIDIGAVGARLPTIYFRKTFYVTNAALYEGLILRLLRDDGAAIYLNGELLYSDGVSIPSHFSDFAMQVVGGNDEITYFEHSLSSTLLVNGTNILAVEVKNATSTSSDLAFDL